MKSVGEPEPEPELWSPAAPVPARRATGSVDAAALLALFPDVGLEDRSADVAGNARASVRLTGDARGEARRSRLGGSPDLPAGFVWPTWDGRELGFLGQVDLGDLAAADPETPFPHEGLLLFFYDLVERPSGLLPAHRGSCRVVLLTGQAAELEADGQHAPALHPLPVEASRELMLPSAWSFNAEPLELSPDEMDAWNDLRERLAEAQGVELEDTSPDQLTLHRLLGYPDETGREVEVSCQLASAGLDAEDVGIYYGSAADHDAEARTWRLLLQLTLDDSLETRADSGFDRLYVCIREADLRDGRLDTAWAIMR
ncbi:MAG: YwqG family protein [Gaiellaceae bacterium]